MDRLHDFELAEAVETSTLTVTRRGTSLRDQRAVLVKTFKPELHLSSELLEALEREREMLVRIDHPGLPTLMTSVSDGERRALVFVDHHGHRLDAVLERVERLEPLAAVAIAIQIGGVLAAIHRHGEAHGGLRPQVVELTDQGMVYLHGLGTHPTSARDGEGDELTLPENLAPEQLVDERADAQTDIFMLGVLIYRMIAGRFPFGGRGGSLGHSIRHDEAATLSAVVKGVPDRLDRVVSRCLEKRRRDRYGDVTSVQSELTALLFAESSLPLELLVSRALAKAGLAEELAAPAEKKQELGIVVRSRPIHRLVGPVVLLVAIAVVSVWLWRSARDATPGASRDARGILDRQGKLRLLAHPWAEIYIDGKLVDVTPVARAIEVAPGSHVVVFKHPNAPDEKRTIEVIAGQTMWLDVDMAVARPPRDAGARDGGGGIESP